MNTKADPALYLDQCDVIDFDDGAVAGLAAELRSDGDIATAERCFRFVRDEIKHSSDFQLNPVTCRASEVLAHRTGYCYAKSHLLCAVLRANRIPAGMCYQRLSIDGTGAPFCLHGLNAVYLPEFGWYRVDARGNRADVNAEFTPPTERLAFAVTVDGESNLAEIYSKPLPAVIKALHSYDDWELLGQNLPDQP